MRIASGTVKDGKIVVEGVDFEEGCRVTVLAPDGESAFDVTDEERRKLLAAIDEADRGEWISGEQLLDDLRSAD